MKIRYTLCLLFALPFFLSAQQRGIIPQPVQFQTQTGSVEINATTPIVLSGKHLERAFGGGWGAICKPLN